MTILTVETQNDWTKMKIKSAIHIEIELLRKAVRRTQQKLRDFENKQGNLTEIPFMAKWTIWNFSNGKENVKLWINFRSN